MLNIFPSLLILGIFAPFILRVTVGVYLFYTGYQHLNKERESVTKEVSQKFGSYAKAIVIFVGFFEIIIGLSLFVGFLTQVIALFGMLYVLKMFWLKKQYPILIKHEMIFYVMLFVVLFSLLITGAGVLAIDLPL